MSSSKQRLQSSYPLHPSTIPSETCPANSVYNTHTGEFILAESLPPPISLPNSYTLYNNSIAMEDSDHDIVLSGEFLEEIRPEDSVSQTFHYLECGIPMPQPRGQLMEIDQTINDSASSALSAPPSSLLTPSAAAYSDIGENVEFSSQVPDTSQMLAAFLAKRKRRTAYCWLPCNGIEYFDRRTESWRWKCVRCK